MTDALSLAFDVDTSPDHAFAVWTGRLGTWWPAAKTVSGGPSAIEFEPYVGGRIVETAPDGTEHTWGRVLVWDPPHRLAFTWHLFFDPDEATEVTLTFESAGASTRVVLNQTGFERLGAAGAERRENTLGAWRMLLQRFADVV